MWRRNGKKARTNCFFSCVFFFLLRMIFIKDEEERKEFYSSFHTFFFCCFSVPKGGGNFNFETIKWIQLQSHQTIFSDLIKFIHRIPLVFSFIFINARDEKYFSITFFIKISFFLLLIVYQAILLKFSFFFDTRQLCSFLHNKRA